MGLLSFLILAAIAIALYATQGKRLRKTGITLGSVLIFFIGLSLAFGTISNRTLNHRKYAIVFAPTLTAKSSPDASGTDLFVIHEGLKVRITETVGGWSRIRLPDGNEAWVPDSAVTRI
jgi:SH3-like domain-containing protein